MTITHPVTLQVSLARISLGERLRAVDPDYVALLSESMREQGLMTPIEIGPEDGEGIHTLIAGAHRLEAARRLGWAEITARVFGGDAIQARLREIDENLCRHDLTELDRAIFLASRKALYEQLNPETRHGGKRRGDQVAKFGHLSFSADAAEKLGVSERAIRRSVRRAEALAAETRQRITGTPIARRGAEIDVLAALPHAEQLRLLDLMDERGIAKVGAALRVMRGAPPSADDETMFLRFTRQWEGWTPALRARVHAFVVAETSKKRRGEAA